jgi:hypothetical protein
MREKIGTVIYLKHVTQVFEVNDSTYNHIATWTSFQTGASFKTFGVFGLWSHSMLHEVMHHKFIPSILVESTHFSCVY